MFDLRLKICNLLTPFLKIVGKIRFPYAKKRLHEKHVNEILAVIELGDIILTKTYGELTNLIIPSHFKHASIYVGDNKVVEAVDPRSKLTGIYDHLLSKDEVYICRSKHQDRKQAAWEAMKYVGAKYDYHFIMQDKNVNFYCSELVYWSHFRAYGCQWFFTLRKSLGSETVKPDDFKNAVRFFDLVYKG